MDTAVLMYPSIVNYSCNYTNYGIIYAISVLSLIIQSRKTNWPTRTTFESTSSFFYHYSESSCQKNCENATKGCGCTEGFVDALSSHIQNSNLRRCSSIKFLLLTQNFWLTSTNGMHQYNYLCLRASSSQQVGIMQMYYMVT